MKKRLFFVIVVFLLALPGYCTISVKGTARLRLLRTTSPDGEWQEVPAETLPVVDGEFEDSFGAPSAYYRMRIDLVEMEGPPTSISLESVAPIARQIAQQHLEENRDIGGDNGWEGAVLGPVAFPMYNPPVQGIAYIEFKVIGKPPLPPEGSLAAGLPPPEDRGFIIVSLTDNDYPIVSYATEKITRTEHLRKQAKSSGVRIFRYDDAFMAAENAQGEMVAHTRSQPVRYPDSICDYVGKEFEHVVDEQGEQIPPDAPDLTGEPYESYQAFKQDYLNSERLKLARQLRREQAKIRWDLYGGLQQDGFEVTVGARLTCWRIKW